MLLVSMTANRALITAGATDRGLSPATYVLVPYLLLVTSAFGLLEVTLVLVRWCNRLSALGELRTPMGTAALCAPCATFATLCEVRSQL